ncbi:MULTISPECIES: 3-oxo-tetronate kinase [unclassified Salinibacterium]|uniref:3-oxo-tetronate kinase n=1 Tax=unclassified Salinibacterium TaxID=2632331 RepID=UPI00141E397E|nr:MULTISPECIES: 3-oxo-tetronate kinase [unclassified Salinibacterium]
MTSTPWLGVVADDYTGATDLAGMIARQGLRVVQYLGVPDEVLAADVDCVVVALKNRSTPAAEAVAEAREAAEWLRELGVAQLYFKYCSTFDSTDAGNIGPVGDALADLVDARAVVFCPATPEHGRTTYLGHHFVHDTLLSESPLRDHPLNPMRDPDLRRVLARQTSTPVTHLPLSVVQSGAAAAALDAHTERAYVIADAATDDDVRAIARAVASAPLVTGGAALAAMLAELHIAERADAAPASVEIPAGRAVVLAGSCSAATRRQLDRLGAHQPRFQIDAYALDRGEDVVGAALAFVAEHADALPIVAASSDPETVARVQSDLGLERSARLVEDALGRIARGVADAGIRRILVAGGESSGAVVNGLGVRALHIGREVAPGVPWTVSAGDERIGLLLKSGNFGGDDVFTTALEMADAS